MHIIIIALCDYLHKLKSLTLTHTYVHALKISSPPLVRHQLIQNVPSIVNDEIKFEFLQIRLLTEMQTPAKKFEQTHQLTCENVRMPQMKLVNENFFFSYLHA